MPLTRELLNFEVLDDLVLAHERGHSPSVRLIPGVCLGSIVELLNFCHDHGSPLDHAGSPETDAIKRTLQTRRPVYINGDAAGFVTAHRAPHTNDDTHWDSFLFAMHKGMLAAGFPSLFSRGLVGALDEMQNNIHDHSGATDTGLIAYRVNPKRVEWIVADRGIGVLSGLRNGAFPSLSDSGEALKIALTDGRSRFGAGKGRGYGFRELFKALATRQGSLRFRSDDQVLTMTGLSPSLSRVRLQQRGYVSGLAVSVVCAKPVPPQEG